MCCVTEAAHAKTRAMAEETKWLVIKMIKLGLCRRFTSRGDMPPRNNQLEQLAIERFDRYTVQ